MAFNARIAIEVDAATGNDNNGGGFDDTTGTPGTNYAWGAGQTTIAYTDLTTAGVTSVVSSVARAFIAADVGNVINITAGTNFTTGRYQILSVSGGSASLDRNCATGVGSGGTGTLGGSLLTIQKGINVGLIDAGAVSDCRIYIKKGTYTGTVALTTSGGVGPNSYRSKILGYFSVHDDDPTCASGNQPIYAVGSGAGVDGIDCPIAGVWFMNLTLDGAATSGTQGVIGMNYTQIFNSCYQLKIKNFSGAGMSGSGNGMAVFCEVTNCGGTNAAIDGIANCRIHGCYIHKNNSGGVYLPGAGASALSDSLVVNNTGVGLLIGYDSLAIGNTFYGNGSDNIKTENAPYSLDIGTIVMSNIVAKAGGYGINQVSPATGPDRLFGTNYNAFYANASGDRTGVDAGPNDVSVSTNPFVSSDANLASETSPNWGLNSTTGAGASLRAAGFPGAFSGLTTTIGYRDMGAVQHQDSGGTGGQKSFTFIS